MEASQRDPVRRAGKGENRSGGYRQHGAATAIDPRMDKGEAGHDPGKRRDMPDRPDQLAHPSLFQRLGRVVREQAPQNAPLSEIGMGKTGEDREQAGDGWKQGCHGSLSLAEYPAGRQS